MTIAVSAHPNSVLRAYGRGKMFGLASNTVKYPAVRVPVRSAATASAQSNDVLTFSFPCHVQPHSCFSSMAMGRWVALITIALLTVQDRYSS